MFGDGVLYNPDTGSCEAKPHEPGRVVMTKDHVYNQNGRWEFIVTATSGNCEHPGSDGWLRAWIQVGAGQTTSQGPEAPEIRLDQFVDPGSPPPRDVFQPYVWGHDIDGYVSKLVVDYGDGSSPQSFPGDPNGCRQGPSGWPAESEATTPWDPPPHHRYAAPGTYRVRATVISEGCDGGQRQKVSATFDFVFGEG